MMNNRMSFYLLSVMLLLVACQSHHAGDTNEVVDPYTIESEVHLIDEIPTLTADSLINVVIEIPTGTLEKWEVDKPSGNLKLEFRNGKPRKVNYLGYPGNYGMVPKTLLPENQGGDGDPLDVIVIGEAMERGSVVPCLFIGVVELLDKGEQDDKLIAVPVDSHFAHIQSIQDLREQYKGAVDILETWFTNYKGPGKIEIKRVAEAERAYEILNYAMEGYKKGG